MSGPLAYTPPEPLEMKDAGEKGASGMYQNQLHQNQQQQHQRTRVKGPSNFEVLQACVNDLTGKDKLAKIVLYAIRLLTTVHSVHGMGNPAVARKIRSANILERKTPDQHADFVLNESQKTPTSIMTTSATADSIMNFSAFRPALTLVAKLLLRSSNALSTTRLERGLLLLLAFLVDKLSDLMAGLSVYRHLLRAGTIPFRVWKFSNHIRYSLQILLDQSKLDGPATRIQRVLNYWTTKDMISQMANFWYAVTDEILLIFRFNLLLNGSKGGGKLTSALYSWAEDHELYSWMATILLGLHNDWNTWVLLKDEQSRIILNQKVRARTRRIVSNLKRNKSMAHSGEFENEDDVNTEEEETADGVFAPSSIYVDQLEENRKNLTIVQIDAVRLFCDLVFDAQYIFQWNMYKPFHVSLGLLSGSLGFYKVWRQQKERLAREAIIAAEAEAEAKV